MNLGTATKRLPPWAWISTLYFAQALPYVAVNVLSVIMYKRMGLDNGTIAFYTGWLYLPWVIKPFWSPIVDLIKTKRWWILTMQLVIAISLAGVAFVLPGGWFFTGSLCVFWLMGFASATHDIAADGYYMIALNEHDQTFYVGIRSTFYRIATVTGQGALVIVAGFLERRLDSISQAWMWTFMGFSVFFLAVMLWHCYALPQERPQPRQPISGASFLEAFRTFFTKKQVLIAIAFMLLYRLPEAQLVKLISPFLLDPHAAGGLGLSTEEVGIVYGTVGIIGLTIGGIIGGIVAARYGLKRCLHPMAWAMSLTCATFIYLSIFQPQSLLIVNICVCIEQFGYGFGFTAYMLYLIYFSEGPLKTSHYAMCTGFMALSMMLPGMVAGYLQQWLGYTGFFMWTMICCVATIGVSYLIHVAPEFGKKTIKN